MANGNGSAAGAAGKAAATAGSKKGFLSWYQGHKPEAFIGAAGIVVAIALYVKSRESSSSSSGTTGTTATTTNTPLSLAPDTGNYGGGGGDMAGFDTLLSQLSAQLSALTPAASSSSSSSSTPSGPVTTAAGSYYAIGAGETLPSGTETYYEPISGSDIFDPIPTPGSGYKAGEQQYAFLPSGAANFQKG